MRLVDCEQRTMEWFAARCGRVTASRMGEVIAKISITKKGVPRKSKYSMAAPRLGYLNEIVLERLTGDVQEHFNSAAMKWGAEWESIARTEYELATNSICDQVGFGFHPRWDWSGASPDSLVGRDGGFEAKCPTAGVHLEYLRTKTVPVDYAAQCHWNIEVFEREWWDWMSFHPRFPKDKQKLILRVYRDEAILRELRAEAEKFNAEAEYELAQLGEESILPPIEPFLSGEYRRTERIGNLDVPADLAAMFDEEIVP